MRRIPVDDRIKGLIAKALGSDAPPANVENFGVFECIAVTTRPISQSYSPFDGAVISKETLDEMANLLNSGLFVPFHTLHEQGYELPVGRNISAQVHGDGNGFFNLHTLFFVDPTEEQLIQKLDNGTIDEVSIGLLTKELKCSGCGWDYMQDDWALWDRTCENGHVLGKGGYHLILNGVNKWMETSLVSKGASPGNKVLGNKQRLLASQLSAAQLNSAVVLPKMLFSAPTVAVTEPKLSEDEMKELEQLTAKLGELTTQMTTLSETVTQVTQANAALTEANTLLASKLTEAETKLTQLSEGFQKLEALGGEGVVTKLTTLADSADTLQGLEQKIESGLAKLQETPAEVHPFRLPVGGIVNLNTTPSGTAPAKQAVSPAVFKTNR